MKMPEVPSPEYVGLDVDVDMPTVKLPVVFDFVIAVEHLNQPSPNASMVEFDGLLVVPLERSK